MADSENAVAVTPGAGVSVYTVTRGSKEVQVVVPGGVGGTPLASVVTVGVTATALPASALANRKAMYVYNNGAADIFVGGSGVTTATGVPVAYRTGQSFDVAAGCVLYAISGTAGQDVRVLEIS